MDCNVKRNTCMCSCVNMYAFMGALHVCVHVCARCMYAGIHMFMHCAYINVSTYVYVHVHVYFNVCISVSVCMCSFIFVRICAHVRSSHVYMYIWRPELDVRCPITLLL